MNGDHFLPQTDRRGALVAIGALGGLPLALHAPPLRAAVPTDRITVLYRREGPQAPTRLEPVVQAATLALENEMLQRGLRVLQPTADVYRLLDQGEAVVITFAEDAGFSLLFSAYRDLRAAPGQDAGIAEVRLQLRVFVGRHVLVADEGRGQMFTRLEPATREFGERRALELAARRAAADAADKVATRLKSLSAQEINQLVGDRPSSSTTAAVVPLPAATTAPVAPVPAAPAPATVPLPAPPTSGAQASPGVVPSTAPSAPSPPVSAPLPAPRQRWALVVGMSNYASVRAAGAGGVTDLPGVARDTAAFVGALRQMGFAEERMAVLRDDKATGAAVRGFFKQFAGRVQADDVVVIFISAHGGDKQFSYSGYGMPILADFRPDDAGLLDFWELQSMVRNLRGRVVWVIDTCHAGGAATNVQSVVMSASGVASRGEVRGPDAMAVARGAGSGRDVAILTASAPHEISWETGEGGLFTSRLLAALRRSGGSEPLGQMFAERVAREVIDQSKLICQRQNACSQHPQQTPTMAYEGSGHLIRL